MTTENTDPLDPWHALPANEALRRLDATPDGLTGQGATERLARYGPNALPVAAGRSALRRFGAQFTDVLIHILIVAGVLTAVIGEWADAIVILAVVLINAFIGFVQEGKAEAALAAIRGMLAPTATVQRDKRWQTLPAVELVPGDVVRLESGDRVPADLRLLTARELRVEEAALTGESLPAHKATAPVDTAAGIGDRACMAFSGTLVTHGVATALVTGTGLQTEIGRIQEMLHSVDAGATPLLRKMTVFGRWLSGLIVVVAAATFAAGVLWRGYSSTDMFMAVVGLAVAAIPEGLPAIITITLAVGVQRMARRNAIIRRLPAVETLGAVTVICSDKTGTLTRNEMTVRAVSVASGLVNVTGGGYEPTGGFERDEIPIRADSDPALSELLIAASLCSDANLVERDGRWSLVGDPTEGALVTLATKGGLDVEAVRALRPRVDVLPFESARRYMATLHREADGANTSDTGRARIYIKGAPERLLPRCTHARGEDGRPLDRAAWDARAADLARRGNRVLAIATCVAPRATGLEHPDVEGGLELLGLVGLLDPPREEAIRAIAACHRAGIAVKMVTGDHVETAKAIAAQMGIGDGSSALAGEEIEALDAAGLSEASRTIDVFARVSPEHKLRLVEAISARGEIVAMTGDGVNDAPALKRADVGVAMGIKGTDVAKEASEIVLADDDFSSIAAAVEQGRTIDDNIRKAILFILPTNAAEAGVIIAAVFLGRSLPITALQILWINMITAVTLALALAVEPSEADVMNRPPRKPGMPILTPLVIWRVFFVGLLLVVGTFGLFSHAREAGESIEVARTHAVNMLVGFEVFYLFNARSTLGAAWSLDRLFINRAAIAAGAIVLLFQMALTYVPFLQKVFGTAAIPLTSWLHISAIAAGLFFVVEAEKAITRHVIRRRTGAQPPG